MTNFPLSGLRSVEIEVPDLDAATRFYTDVWGLMPSASPGGAKGTVHLRGHGTDPYLLSLTGGPAIAVRSVTWRAAERTDLEALRARMTAAGGTDATPVAPVPDAGGGTGFTIRDPGQRKQRIVQGDTPAAPAPNDAHRPARLAHVNINSADLDRDIAFYHDAFGFRLTDRSGMMGFLRTNVDHHALVLAKATVETMNHVAFLHESAEDMMKAGGKMCDAGYSIGWGPGRHGPGDNVFLYFVDPFGLVIEHTAEVLPVDDSYPVGGPEDWTWPAGRTDQWGIAPPKSKECKRAQLSVRFK
ncbi:VOC family protein [Wenxinia marina]|uniref:Lactoylglutathione lyase n=1 Tax=Wenxinia marina DSM 24838 TaxID=1123501 RepID=A0A0D0Q381_9RHOB|nr:VOC family protein [Wenxinia marina]KIQ69009.1 Lactoylglutathione lyase [Wenxinia marina DSM 24838]GGL81069.1 oxidoreductase [Wenxinia marina]